VVLHWFSDPALDSSPGLPVYIFTTSKYSIIKVRVMVFNATFNNISVVLWQLVLLVGKTQVTGENY
jgi:hypothetical protein